MLKTSEVDRLIGALMIYIRQNPEVLEQAYPAEHKRLLAVKLEHLLMTEQ